MIRILIADDLAIIRKGVKQILTEAYPNAEIEEVEDGEDWADKLNDCPWDIVIADRPGPTPQVPVLIINLYKHFAYDDDSAGWVGRDAAPDELVWAVRELLAGKKYHPVPSKEN